MITLLVYIVDAWTDWMDNGIFHVDVRSAREAHK